MAIQSIEWITNVEKDIYGMFKNPILCHVGDTIKLVYGFYFEKQCFIVDFDDFGCPETHHFLDYGLVTPVSMNEIKKFVILD